MQKVQKKKKQQLFYKGLVIFKERGERKRIYLNSIIIDYQKKIPSEKASMPW